jgi:hypothetical protein
MQPRNDQESLPLFSVTLKGLQVPQEKRPELEKAAAETAAKADALGYLDPLDIEPAVVFDPTVRSAHRPQTAKSPVLPNRRRRG